MNNRIAKYFDTIPEAKCVVTSNFLANKITMSYLGNKFVWEWASNGLICPGNPHPLEIHPLAAEALIVEEINAFFCIEGVAAEEVIFINQKGESIGDIILSPPEIGSVTWDIALKKNKIRELFERYTEQEDCLSEEIIGEAISFGVLAPFLTLVNL
jgi:hypothetical protein